MTVYFADISAIAKRYIAETGSVWVKQWADPQAGNIVVTSDLTTVEMISLLARREREGTLTPQARANLEMDFLWHAEHEYLTVPLEPYVLIAARNSIAKYPLRALDAIQLASAVQATQLLMVSMIFVSSDQGLLAAAAAQGFSTDDPNAHP